MVFGRSTDHGGPADIDIFDAVIIGFSGPHGFLERIEIDHQKIDGADPMRQHRGLMHRIGADGEQAAMDFRMQGFDPSIHHFRKACHIGHVLNRQACGFQTGTSASCRNQLDPARMQGLCEIQQSRLVGNGKQSAGDAAKIMGHEHVQTNECETENSKSNRLRHSMRHARVKEKAVLRRLSLKGNLGIKA